MAFLDIQKPADSLSSLGSLEKGEVTPGCQDDSSFMVLDELAYQWMDS